VGLLGGTFDPVHEGHLHAATCVRTALGLARVMLLPCALPPHKPGGLQASDEDRLEMLRRAIADRPGLEICTWEIDRGGTHYTVETLRALRREQGWDPVFIVGMDALADLATWRQPEALLAEFDLVAVDRPGRTRDEVIARVAGIGAARFSAWTGSRDLGRGGRIFHLAIPPRDVSASEIRRRCANGASLDDLVPPAVARYIRERKLYRLEVAR
jgi:nicotinate-nucleotide adenylyltransferase